MLAFFTNVEKFVELWLEVEPPNKDCECQEWLKFQFVIKWRPRGDRITFTIGSVRRWGNLNDTLA